MSMPSTITEVDRSVALARRKGLGPGAKSLERGSTFASPHADLKRTGGLKRGRGLRASERQRVKVAGHLCLVCGVAGCDPAHVIPRSLGGCDDPLCVVPLCRDHHRAYDTGRLNLLALLTVRRPLELEHAIQHLGRNRAIWRITNIRPGAPSDV